MTQRDERVEEPGGLVFTSPVAEGPRLAPLVVPSSRLDPDDLVGRAMLAGVRSTPFFDVRVRLDHATAAVRGRVPRATASELAARLRGAIEALLDRRLAGYRRVAVLSGGGVDSSTLLAHALAWARRTGGSAFGVALDFASPGDDRPHRRALAAHLGCPILEVTPEQAARRVELLVAEGVDALPLTWPSAPMEIEAMARARAEGAECVLMGVGADELFDGAPTAVAERPVLESLRAARALRGFARPRVAGWTWALRPRLARRVPLAVKRARSRRAGLVVPAWAGPRWERVARGAREAAIAAMREPPETVPLSHRWHIAWLRHQESVAAGVARLDPFLDPALVAEVESWPRAALLAGDVRRGLFREAARGLVPESLRLREDKASFEPALARMLDAAPDARARLARLVELPALTAMGATRGALFAEPARALLAGRDGGEGWGEVWPALAVEAFAEGRSAA